MVIDHVGIVVKSIEAGIEHWETIFGYKQQTKIVINKRQEVKVVFLVKESSLSIKLVEPINQKSSLFRMAQRGGGLHHLCFRCQNLDDAMDHMKKNSQRILCPPQPGEAFDNNDIAFVYSSGVNIEFIDTGERAQKIL